MTDDVRLRRFRQSPVEAILDGINAKLPAAGDPMPVEISGAAVNLTGDVTIGTVTVDNTAQNAVPINAVAGTLTISDGGGSITVDGPLTDTQLRASALVIADGGGSITVDGPLTDTQLRASALVIADGGGSITVDGPLTNTQLRATAVPVSGPLTDTQLRATAVPVSGPLTDTQLRAAAVTVAGPLTNTELRAAAVPVVSSVAVRTPTTTSIASSGTSVTFLAVNANRKGLMVSNVSSGRLYLSFSTPATVANAFIELSPGGFLMLDQQLMVTNAIYGIWSSVNGAAQVTEFV